MIGAVAAALTVAAAAGTLAVRGRRAARRFDALLDERLPRGADGIVVGAGPIDLPGDRSRAALLLHGFGDTPQSLTAVACRLHAAGWAVHAPLLPGHGRTLRAFAGTGAGDWIGTARHALGELRARHDTVVVVGQSMGGALGVIVTAEALGRAEDGLAPIASLVLLAPYLGMPAGVRLIAPIARALAPLWPYHDGGAGSRSIQDEVERQRSRGYGFLPGVLLAELARVVDRARAALPRVHVPTLVVQSRADHRITPAVCEDAYARLGAPVKELVWLDASGHVIAADRERLRVAGMVVEWVDRRGSRVAGGDDGYVEESTVEQELAPAPDARSAQPG